MRAWQKFVDRSTRWIFAGLVVIMSVTLVLSFTGIGGGGNENEDKPAGKCFGADVLGSELMAARGRAEIFCILVHRVHNGFAIEYRAERPNPQYVSYLGFFEDLRSVFEAYGMGSMASDPSSGRPTFRMTPGWREKHLKETAWEILVLRHDADALRIEVEESELRAEVPRALSAIRKLDVDMGGFSALPDPVTPAEYAEKVGIRFGLPQDEAIDVFEGAVRDAVRARRVLDILAESRPLTDREIVEAQRQSPPREAQARLFVAEIDPARFGSAGVRVGAARVSQLYAEKTREAQQWIDQGAEGAPQDLTIPPRATVDYLAAFYEDYLPQVPEPTEGQLREYYNQNSHRYRVEDEEHSHGESGQGASRPRPFDEVRDQVRTDWRLREARRPALAALQEARNEVVSRLRGVTNEEDRARLGLEIDFAEMARRLGEQQKPLRAGTLPSASALDADRPAIEAVLGKSETSRANPSRDFAAFAFAKDRKLGAIQHPPSHETTDQAVAIFRLRERTSARLYPLTDPLSSQIEEQAAGESVTAAIREFLTKAPRGVVQGVGAIQTWLRTSGVPYRSFTTGYFPVAESEPPPVEPPGLAAQIQRRFYGYESGRQELIDFTHPDRGPRSYLVYVIDNVKQTREEVDSWLSRARAEGQRDRAPVPQYLPNDVLPSWAGRQRMRWIRDRVDAAAIEETQGSDGGSP